MMRARFRALNALKPLSRRKVVALSGGAMLGFPMIAVAQRNATPIIGLLDSATSTADELAAFYDGLKVEGYIHDQTIETIYHSAAGDYSRLPTLAADLVKRQVAVIAAFGVPAARAAKNATSVIPVVFAIDPNPVEIGLVRSLDLPGGNITGVSALSSGRERKRLELLHAVMPAAKEIAILVNPADAGSRIQEAITAFHTMNVECRLIRASAADEFDAAFGSLVASPPGGLIIADDEFFDSRGAELGFLAFQHRIPAIFQNRAFAAAGGLISYGSNLSEIYHQAGAYTGLVLKGAIASSLPIYQSVKTHFIVNTRTATSLGINIPTTMLNAANEVMK